MANLRKMTCISDFQFSRLDALAGFGKSSMVATSATSNSTFELGDAFVTVRMQGESSDPEMGDAI